MVLSPGGHRQRAGAHCQASVHRRALLELPTRAEKDHENAIAYQDDDQPLPSGGRGTPLTGGRQARDEAEQGEKDPSNGVENGYKKIMLLLRNHSGVDFSLYRSSTIQRRIARRIVLTKQDTLKGYDALSGQRQELDSLFSDVLISVTSFFRNPEAFDVLQRDNPAQAPGAARGRSGPLLVCFTRSTGQEAYSLAMSFVEAGRETPRARKFQIFATDLNEKLLEKACMGLYAKTLAQDISPERLRQFFVEEDGGYRISKSLREMVGVRAARTSSPIRPSSTHGPHQLPKSPHLSGSELAAEGDAHVSLMRSNPTDTCCWAPRNRSAGSRASSSRWTGSIRSFPRSPRRPRGFLCRSGKSRPSEP